MKKSPWTKKERQILKDNYGLITMDELLGLLPGRTDSSIASQIYFLRKRGWTFSGIRR